MDNGKNTWNDFTKKMDDMLRIIFFGQRYNSNGYGKILDCLETDTQTTGEWAPVKCETNSKRNPTKPIEIKRNETKNRNQTKLTKRNQPIGLNRAKQI